MQLILSTWMEVQAYLLETDGILIPTGSIEQHGPMGLIGTDMLCAGDIASAAAKRPAASALISTSPDGS